MTIFFGQFLARVWLDIYKGYTEGIRGVYEGYTGGLQGEYIGKWRG